MANALDGIILVDRQRIWRWIHYDTDFYASEPRCQASCLRNGWFTIPTSIKKMFPISLWILRIKPKSKEGHSKRKYCWENVSCNKVVSYDLCHAWNYWAHNRSLGKPKIICKMKLFSGLNCGKSSFTLSSWTHIWAVPIWILSRTAQVAAGINLINRIKLDRNL